MQDHMYLIDMAGGGSVIATGDSVYMDPAGLVVRLGDTVTATLSRDEYTSIGPWTAPPVAPRHMAPPDLSDPAEVASATSHEPAGGAA